MTGITFNILRNHSFCSSLLTNAENKGSAHITPLIEHNHRQLYRVQFELLTVRPLNDFKGTESDNGLGCFDLKFAL